MDPPACNRLKLTVQYDGAAYHGWQLQPDQRTVQGELESVLSRLADRSVRVLGSGRTDAGVHATGQVASADMPPAWTPEKLRASLNATLPRDVWIERVEAAVPDFHPRYDAIARTYRYDIGLRPEAASPFHSAWCWPLCEDLDVTALEQSALAVVGTHSFRSFAKAGQPERGERCAVAAATWVAYALGVRFTITADRYLHHMVRYLVGTMVDVARSRRPLDDMTRLLGNDGGLTTSPPAPPQGLFLHHVEYPEAVHRTNRTDSPPSRSTASA